MAGDAARSVSSEDAVEQMFQAAPEIVVAEIIQGVVMMAPRPRARHTRVASRLGSLLDAAFDQGTTGPGGWVILDEPELHLGRDPQVDKLVPDIAGWRRARMPAIPNVAAFTLAPDWICEVLSPGTEVVDRGSKIPIYAREGVEHAWLVDPDTRTLEAFEREGTSWHALGSFQDSALVRVAPFDAMELNLELLWAT